MAADPEPITGGPAAYGEIQAVTFSVEGDGDRSRKAAVEISNYDLYSGNLPARGGVVDASLGTTSHEYDCATCELGRKLDPGHWGQVVLRAPVLGPLWIDEIRRWLKIICLTCGSPLVDLGRFAGLARGARLKTAAQATVPWRPCPVCKAAQPKILDTGEDHMTITIQAPPGRAGDDPPRPRPFYPAEILDAFGRVAGSTVRALGRPATSHPARLVHTRLGVPPNTIRPGVRQGFGTGGNTSHHDTTCFLQFIVKRNLRVAALFPPGAPWPDEVPEDLAATVQNMGALVHTMVLGTGTVSPTQGGEGRRNILVGSRQGESILRKLPRKKGRIRRNLIGKRTKNIARSTISGNPYLRTTSVGVPIYIARVLQIEETVREYNIERLLRYVMNGRSAYPGASGIRRHETGGSLHRIGNVRGDGRMLAMGDRVLRDLIDGDLVAFNRQPSLERSSISVHQAKILQDPTWDSIQLNVTACPFYNADFDGDAMNLYPLATPPSKAEGAIVSALQNFFISTKTGTPVTAQTQDSTVSSFLLTRSSVRINRAQAMRLFATTGTPPPSFGGDPPDAVYTGRDVVSRLFAPYPVDYDRAPSWYNKAFVPYIGYLPDEIRTVVRRGTLVEGVFDKKAVGATGGGIFHLVNLEYGPQAALDMIFALQRCSIDYAGVCGFTVSLSDITLPLGALREIDQIVSGLLLEADGVTARLVAGQLVPPIGQTTHEYYEANMIAALRTPDELFRPIFRAMDPDTNGLFRMIATGSKGGTPQINAIMGMVGQTLINTRRIRPRFAPGRTSVYAPAFSTAPIDYGFIANSYMRGLDPREYLHGMMMGRFDLITKALSTSSTGHMNRKIILALQSDVVDNYRRVSKDRRVVVQFLYGEDGFDVRRLEGVDLPFVNLDDAGLTERYFTVETNDSNKKGRGRLDVALRAAETELRAARDALQAEFLIFQDTDFQTPVRAGRRNLPVNIGRIAQAVQAARPPIPPPTSATLADMADTVADFCGRIPYFYMNRSLEARRASIPPHLEAATSVFRAHVRAELAPAILAQITPGELTYILQIVRLRFVEALVAYGESVGILAAQAISEPLTQYMLDSHHRSVGGGTDKSGIIRPKEILGAKDVAGERSPEMTLRLVSGGTAMDTRARALQIANEIEFLVCRRFVRRWALLYEPFGRPVYPAYAPDQEWIDDFVSRHPLLPPPEDLARWCIRLVLDKSAMVLKGVSLGAIVGRLRSRNPHMYTVHTPESVPKIVIRAYLRLDALAGRKAGETDRTRAVAQVRTLLETPIRGVRGVVRATVAEKPSMKYRAGPDGSLQKTHEWAVQTVGTNIYGVVHNRQIDPTRIVSSSIADTAELFGIEAARTVIVRELRRFMADKAPNVRHLLLVGDEMTRTGRVTSFEPKGIRSREGNNVFLRMAMASPIDVLREAALAGERGPIHGLAPWLMTGGTPHIGTLFNEAVINEGFVRDNTKGLDEFLDGLGLGPPPGEGTKAAPGRMKPAIPVA